MLACLLTVVTACLFACASPDGLPPQMAIETVVDELLPPLPADAVVEPSAEAARPASLAPGGALGGGGGRPSLVVTAPSRVRMRVAVPPDAGVRFGVGVEGSKRREADRSGVRFRLTVDGTEAFTDVLNPAARRRDRRWRDQVVDLAAWAGKTVDLVLETSADDPSMPLAGRPGWSHVRLTRTERRDRQRAAPDARNVLVLLVDTLRADRVGAYGAGDAATPALDALARGGVVFRDAVAQSSWTLPSVATLLSGLPPRSHGARGDRIHGAAPDGAPPQNAFLADAVVTWPELAQRAGITTMGVSTNPLVSRATNVAQGFETFVELPFDPKARTWATAADVNRAFVDWVEANPGLRFAAWLHYMDVHDPYMPPERLRPPVPAGLRPLVAQGRVNELAKPINRGAAPLLSPFEVAWLERLYAADVRAWDETLGQLLAALDRLGLRESTTIVVTADHGEEFQEHGRLKHGTQLYEETIRVPVILAGPGIAPAARTDTAQGVDLLPTVLPLLGIAPPPGLPGRDLLATTTPSPAVSETSNGILRDGRAVELTATRSSTWKLIQAPAVQHEELYDLARDPGERDDLHAGHPQSTALRETFDAWAAAAPAAPATGGSDAALSDKLRQLGYVD